jgi:hypothetical protein
MTVRAAGSPLRLGSLDDVADDLPECVAAPLGLGAFGVFTFTAKTTPLPQNTSVRLIDDLDVDGELQLASGGDGLLWVGAEPDGDVDIVRLDRPADQRIRGRLGAFANAESAAELASEQLEELALKLRRGGLVLERDDGHRANVRRQAAAGKAVAGAASADDKNEEE